MHVQNTYLEVDVDGPLVYDLPTGRFVHGTPFTHHVNNMYYVIDKLLYTCFYTHIFIRHLPKICLVERYHCSNVYVYIYKAYT